MPRVRPNEIEEALAEEEEASYYQGENTEYEYYDEVEDQWLDSFIEGQYEYLFPEFDE